MPGFLRNSWRATLPAFLFGLFMTSNGGPGSVAAAATGSPGSGALEIVDQGGVIKGSCPLKHTDVRGAISGFLARVTVSQIFENPSEKPIEAVYVFPLPDNAAVDDMTIQVGDRTVRSLIKKREEARAIYENAKSRGQAAALLDQERPNIFTQSVANIMPGEQVTVTISYLQTLQYSDGSYEFVFPMVVGPRYIPGQATGRQAGGWSPDTTQVPDASRITPHITPKGTRAGHDISLALEIDAGVAIQELHSTLHEIDVERTSPNRASVKLRNQAEIPNKDFILKYEVAGGQIEDALLTQSSSPRSKAGPGGYFTFILQPPARITDADVTPKELVFVLDTSGSMYGFPLDQAKKLIDHALDNLYSGDTFNLILFSGETEILFPEPVYPTAENLRVARAFLNGHSGSGGTEMMKAIRAALDPSDSLDHIRVVCFVTDGYVGNDMEIIGEVQKHPNARVFSFGIGDSVNRFLLEGIARAGRGDAEFVTLADKAEESAKRLYEKLHSPLLTDISIDWGTLPVKDVYPQRIPDLFSGRPLVLTGRYTAGAKGVIRLKGKRAGGDFTREIPVNLSADEHSHDALPSFWARQRIDELMSQDWAGLQSGNVKPAVRDEITQLGLDYRLMTQFTSFVAVEERVVNRDGKPVRVEVPVEMPEGVSYDRIGQEAYAVPMAAPMARSAGLASNISSMARAVGGSFSSQKMAATLSPGTAREVISVDAEKIPAKATGERGVLESKLHPGLLKAFDCWKKSGASCTEVRDGKVKVQIWLTGASQAVVGRIKALGFEVAVSAHKEGESLSGTLPVDKLPDLARMAEVKFVRLKG